ncbi:ShlB/FhaC/HecB family hemolysin secretion/activation protein [Nostoc sp. CCY0012]|uniref:ShlB/FhaC/HecB family hemolysin secretion/activation protein n=1 Tax=Nostoc sp. CCY0012 TaxID=1056123 RepID=UPI0039C6676D
MIDNYLQKFSMSWLPLGLSALLSSIISHPTKAQVVDPIQLPPPQDLQPVVPVPQAPTTPPQPLPPPADLFPPAPAPSTPEYQLPENIPQTITVERFEVIGSTVFSAEELAAATAEFIQRPISLAEIFQARTQITELYISKGYITSGAYIPPQTIRSGVIKIQVVEGQLEDIQVTGTQRLDSNYVRSRLAIATSAPLNRQELLAALQLLQLDPLIETLSAELSAGLHPGTSILQVKIQEAKTFSVQAILDNGRSPSVGSFRRRLQLNEANLLGSGDSLSLTYTNTDGSNALDTSYTLPVNPHNGTLTLNWGTAASNVIERPFNILDIQSSSHYYELTFRQPLLQTPTQEFALGVTASRRESDISSSLLEQNETPLSELSPGADAAGSTRISAIRFFQEWTSRNTQEVMALRSQFNLGIGAFNATINPELPDSRFLAWQGQAQWVRLLAPETLLILRGNTQLASRALLPLEQVGLGGVNSVRGYRQDLLLTDNGAVASAEVLLPIVRWPQIDSLLQVVPFVDFGVAWNNNAQNPDPNTLASVGLGLRWTQGNNFTARLDWGIPLVSVQQQNKTWQENGLYFYLQYNSL